MSATQMSAYLEDKILNWAKNNGAFPGNPTGLTLALYSDYFTDNRQASAPAKVSGSSYADQPISFGAVTEETQQPTSAAVGSGDFMTSSATVTFPNTGAGAGYIVKSVAILGAVPVDGSQILWFLNLASSVTVGSNSQLTYNSGAVTVNEI